MTAAAEIDHTGDLVISVTDTGIGIAEADIERAFEPFTQLDSTLARRFEGAGLGLYMSRALAEGHGGRLRLHSRPGEGTTAELRLPASRLIWPTEAGGPRCPGQERRPSMTPLAMTDRLFFERADAQLDRSGAERHLVAALAASDDGELFLEYRESEQISLDDGRIRSAGFDTTLGFGLRAVAGEATGYAHAGRAVGCRAGTCGGQRGRGCGGPFRHRGRAAARDQFAAVFRCQSTVRHGISPRAHRVLAEIDVYARGKDARVKQVMASLSGEWQAVQIMRADGTRVADLRPLVRLNVARGGGAGRAAGDRQLRHRRTLRVCGGDGAGGLARRSR